MSRIRQLRLVVHASDYEQAVHFFRDVLGAPVAEEYASDGGAHVTILDVGRATLELSNDAQVELIDRGRGRTTGCSPPSGCSGGGRL